MNKSTLLYKRVIQLAFKESRVDPNPRPDVYEAICRSKAITWRTQPAHHRYVYNREQYIKDVKQKLKVNELLGDSSRKTYDSEGKMRRQIPVYKFRQSIGKHLSLDVPPLQDVPTSVQDYLQTFIERQVAHQREMKLFLEKIENESEGKIDKDEVRGMMRIGEKSDSDTDTERIIDLSSQSDTA